MKVFLDNCLPRTLKPYLSADHQVEHARDRQWGDLSNGELLRRVFVDEINASLDTIQSGEIHYIGEPLLLKGLRR